MSEEFDKEAEREKLREKLGNDEEQRSATKRMSELLLQGATMTNQHCDNCGDPLFRDDGETFCPTCSGAAGGQAATPQEVGNTQPPSPQTGEDAGTTRESPSQLPENAEVVPRSNDEGEAPRRGRGRPTTQREGQQPSGQRERPERNDQRGTPRPPETGATGGEPVDELRRAVTEAARKASAATDPRTARAWLEASKEAAEALAALER